MEEDCVKTVRLSDFFENPDNPSVYTQWLKPIKEGA